MRKIVVDGSRGFPDAVNVYSKSWKCHTVRSWL